MDLGENARRDIVLNLEDMGIEVESSHHETAPAQHLSLIHIFKMPKFLCEEMQEYLQMLYGLKKKDRIFTVTKNIVEVYI